MDEERKDDAVHRLSEMQESAGEEDGRSLSDGNTFPLDKETREAEPGGEDLLSDSGSPEAEPDEAETEPRIRLRSGEGKRRRLVRKDDQPRIEMTGAQRLLLLDTWRRSQLPATNSATPVGVTKHTLYGWKKRFDADRPAERTDRETRAAVMALFQLMGPGVGLAVLLEFFPGVARRADRVLKTLKHARLTNSHEAELRKFLAVDSLIIDDFGLDTMYVQEGRDAYEIFTERHRAGSMVLTSNRGPDEWIATFVDPIRAQSAVDRFTYNAYNLVMGGESYRSRPKPSLKISAPEDPS